MSALEELLGPLYANDDFPVPHLSPSSIDGFWKCPEQWRREKLDKELRPATPEQIFGSAFHRGLEHNYGQKIDSHEDLPVPEMRDLAGDSFNEIVEREKHEKGIEWRDAKPNVIQSEVIVATVGDDSTPGFHQVISPTVQPVTVERWVKVDTPIGIPLNMRIDVETDREIIDNKTSGKRKSQADLDTSTQAAAYLWARRAEGNPADSFKWHTAIRTKKPQQQELVTARTDFQLAQFERLMDTTARTIGHYMSEYGAEGPWPGASPLAWWCSLTQCSFFGNGGCPWTSR